MRLRRMYTYSRCFGLLSCSLHLNILKYIEKGDDDNDEDDAGDGWENSLPSCVWVCVPRLPFGVERDCDQLPMLVLLVNILIFCSLETWTKTNKQKTLGERKKGDAGGICYNFDLANGGVHTVSRRAETETDDGYLRDGGHSCYMGKIISAKNINLKFIRTITRKAHAARMLFQWYEK